MKSTASAFPDSLTIIEGEAILAILANFCIFPKIKPPK